MQTHTTLTHSRIPVTSAIASPRGDIPCTADRAALPLEGCDAQLTYGAYFEAIEAFVARDGYAPLRAALAGTGCDLEGVREIVLKAEKHGALYHPASLTLGGPDGETVRLCVNVAVTDVARDCLAGEAGLLGALRDRFGGTSLPEPYAAGEVAGCGMLLEQWFAGFHEFHQDGAGRVRLWDYDAGERLLDPAEALAVYREAARILTLYYDPETGASLGPWHHAAGDFVARVAEGRVDVRCITVRGYGAAHDFSQAGPMAGKLALLAFFTDLTLRMRLDRVDGVGQLVLAGEDVARAAVAGFATALGERPDTRDSAPDLLAFLASFSPEELAGAGRQLAAPCPPDEDALFEAAWPDHAVALAEALAAVTAG